MYFFLLFFIFIQHFKIIYGGDLSPTYIAKKYRNNQPFYSGTITNYTTEKIPIEIYAQKTTIHFIITTGESIKIKTRSPFLLRMSKEKPILCNTLEQKLFIQMVFAHNNLQPHIMTTKDILSKNASSTAILTLQTKVPHEIIDLILRSYCHYTPKDQIVDLHPYGSLSPFRQVFSKGFILEIISQR